LVSSLRDTAAIEFSNEKEKIAAADRQQAIEALLH
jgi:hypothetical protein